jgi:hypothetical protein
MSGEQVEGILKLVKASKWDETLTDSVHALLMKHLELADQGRTDLAQAMELLSGFTLCKNAQYGRWRARLWSPLSSPGRLALCRRLMETMLRAMAAESDCPHADPENRRSSYP